ncbi:ABC transporter permease [Alkalicoccobacillus porphyridii]|uniref:ABC transporter permease n=1 Tax=Alkalicoccobacillus porphyridii TaxID=2597270 RepID=A0A553ZV40_9BACI|nr:ABC transporter permease [Alkalicoccobacillus porphyridii]TSB45329.1 ABC transporter permease [Alkalicoccobacillus porphyridii]
MMVFRFALKRSFSSKTNLLCLAALPIALIFLPYDPESWMRLPYGYHYFSVVLLFVSVRLAVILLEDRQKGIIKRIAIAPITYLSYLSQNVFAFTILLLIQIIIMIIGGLLYGHELYHATRLFILYVMFAFTSLSMALAWVSLYRSKETSFLVYMALVVLMALLSGIMLPMEIMPDSVEKIAFFLPTYWYNEAINVIVTQASFIDFLLPLSILLLYAVLFLLIGSKRRIV